VSRPTQRTVHSPAPPLYSDADDAGSPTEDGPRSGVAAWIDSLLDPKMRENRDLQRRARLLVASSIGFALVCLFFAAQMALAGRYPISSVLVLVAGMGLSVFNIPLMRWLRSTVVPGTLLCLESTLLIAYQAFNDTGLMDPTLLWNLLLPWLAAFLIGPLYGFVFAGVVVAMTVGFFVLQASGYPFPMYSTQEEIWIFYMWCMSGIALFIGTIGWIYEGQTLRDLRETNDHLRETRDALRESNQRTIDILESITNGFFAIDDEDRFYYINRQAERLLSAFRSELLHSHIHQYFESEDGQVLLDYIALAQSQQQPQLCEVFFGEIERWFEFHVYPFASGTSVFFSDITSRKTYEQQLVVARERAEEVAQVKSQLLTNMSHEIRTPLTAILGFAQILSEETEGAHQEFGQLIEQNGKRLLATLNSVLDLAQLEDPAGNVTVEPINLKTEVWDASRLFQTKAKDRGLYLKTELPPDEVEVMAQANSNYVNRILVNLIGNALKFTEEGGITIGLRCEGEWVDLYVTDTGQGIATEFMPHIFDEFRQESTGLSRSHEGNGLGLAITRRLVEQMDGSIDVESAKGEGTTFTVRLAVSQTVPATTEA